MAWIILVLAGLFEVAWAVGLKYTEGFSRFWPSVGTITAMVISVGLLALAVKSLPLSTAYAIWTGIGAVGAVILGITSGAGTYVGVGTEDNFNGAVYSSPDGVTWQHEVNPQVPRTNEYYEQWQDDLYSAVYGDGVFVAVGSYGVILRSEDAHTWTVERSGTQDSLMAVVRVSGQFVAVGDNGTILTSPDGHVWTRRVAPQTKLMYWSAAVGRDTLVVMGADIGKKSSRTIVTSIPITQLAGVDPISPSIPVAIGDSGGSRWFAADCLWQRSLRCRRGQ